MHTSAHSSAIRRCQPAAAPRLRQQAACSIKARARRPLAVRSSNSAPAGSARIKVVGVGGGGCNALQRMVTSGVKGVEFWAVNTDAQALAQLQPLADSLSTVQIGQQATRGLGCGGQPELGRAAARESEEALRQVVAGADLVFVTAGEGGGTGSGAAPVVAQAAKDAGILTVGVVTYPFSFEGRRRRQQAAAAIGQLRQCLDSLIIIPNEKLLAAAGAGTTLMDAFSCADDVLRQAVQGISDIITQPGLINVDFADVRSVMASAGTAMLGIGEASGPDRAELAALAAIRAPLAQQSVESATGIIFNISAAAGVTLGEVNRVSEVVTSLADPAANIIFGAVVDETLQDKLRVTIIATGFSSAYMDELFDDGSTSSNRSSRTAAPAAQQRAVQTPPKYQALDAAVHSRPDEAAAGNGRRDNATKQVFDRSIL